MQSATLDAIVFRSANPVKRAMDVICLIMLQLLTLMVLAAEQNPQKLRNHRALGPNSILARLDAGETFDLPPLVVASIRALTSEIRTQLGLDGFSIAQSASPLPSLPQTSAVQANAKRRRAIKRQARPAAPRCKPHTLQTMPLHYQPSNKAFSKEKAFRASIYPRPFRCYIVMNRGDVRASSPR
jgi:hypothetical protein